MLTTVRRMIKWNLYRIQTSIFDEVLHIIMWNLSDKTDKRDENDATSLYFSTLHQSQESHYIYTCITLRNVYNSWCN